MSNIDDDSTLDMNGVVFSTASFSRAMCIDIPQRSVNMGMDIKFEDDPYNVKLNGIMTADEFIAVVKDINAALLECRATTLDHTLLMMGPTMLPLIPWAIRSKMHKTQRKKIMKRCVESFNHHNPLLVMRWQTHPEKQLSIMRKRDAEIEMNK